MPDNTSTALAALLGLELPEVKLRSTTGSLFDLADLPPLCIVILYPAAFDREQASRAGWLDRLGAGGCTELLLDFKEHHDRFREKEIAVVGISTQSTFVQQAAADDLGLPFLLLSDGDHALARGLGLPMLNIGRVPRMPRVVLGVRNNKIERIFHVGGTPSDSAADVLSSFSNLSKADSLGGAAPCPSRTTREPRNDFR